MKVAQRNDGNVLLDEVCRMNDLQPSCRIVGQNLENLKDAKQTGFRPKANFVQRQSIGDVAVFINQKFKYILKMNSEKKVEVAPSSGNIANALLCAVNSSDTLLELYRDYTDKEKLHWIIRDYKTLEKKFRNVVLENKNLKAKNEKLNKRIKEDDLQYPSQLNGEKYVSVKAYFKLRERYKQMEDRFWEVMQELNNLKSNSDCERL